MAKKKNGVNIVALLLVALAVLYLIQNPPFFLGALVTVTDNVEPVTLLEWQNEAEDLGGNFVLGVPFKFERENGTEVSLTSYDVDYTIFEELSVVDTVDQGYSCNSVLALIDGSRNDTSYSLIEQRQVLIVGSDFLWCNYNNNLLLSASDISTISTYYDRYIIEDTVDIGITSEECDDAGGTWNGNLCVCPDGSSLITTGAECPDNSTSTTTSTSTSTTTNNDGTTTKTELYLKSFWETYNLFIYLSGALLIAYYFFFEIGPDKGFIKKKGSRTRRKKRRR